MVLFDEASVLSHIT